MKIDSSISGNLDIVKKMLQGRMRGLTYPELAERHATTESTVRYLCEKYSVTPFDIRTINEVINKVGVKKKYAKKAPLPPVILVEKRFQKYADLIYEDTNGGKSYADYLKASGLKIKEIPEEE